MAHYWSKQTIELKQNLTWFFTLFFLKQHIFLATWALLSVRLCCQQFCKMFSACWVADFVAKSSTIFGKSTYLAKCLGLVELLILLPKVPQFFACHHFLFPSTQFLNHQFLDLWTVKVFFLGFKENLIYLFRINFFV